MAGLAAISLQQRADQNGRPFAGARAQFYEADTLNPIITYQDYSLASPHPNPVVSNAYGVFPAIFIDEEVGFYRMRVTTAQGVTIDDLTTLPVIGPGDGGGGSEVPVDPDGLIKTGYPLWLPKSGSLAGFIRMNGRTFGSASSGASERANADCEALYLDAWGTYSDTLCPVTGGRGASAAADWAANKPMGTLDMRNKGPFGLDDMGNTAASGFTGITFSVGNATTAASAGGAARHSLTLPEIPAHDHGGNTGAGTPHSHTINLGVADMQSGGAPITYVTASPTARTIINSESAHTHPITSAGGGQPHSSMPPFRLGTWYWKL